MTYAEPSKREILGLTFDATDEEHNRIWCAVVAHEDYEAWRSQTGALELTRGDATDECFAKIQLEGARESVLYARAIATISAIIERELARDAACG